ncbi:hypothetical protein PC129_g21388 [Phytophthora cactorum]|uniref:Uncharacterized protein n=2 Tax=Phytophthora cactorum TaxID=29920 RepID=A0A8T1H5X1_9STRA|nr:hypothetical protein Pcac1_g7352 [Phytophthora cactorum]KAG2884669.1 hypothetical protein PC114_g19978 [Phytophthora cactorum]KAG3207573.1 hypothetical protein PC129_g21388 [Phytophthora cactorum]
MKLLVDAILNVDLVQEETEGIKELMHVAANAHRTLRHHRDADDGHANAAVKVVGDDISVHLHIIQVLGSIKELRQQLKLVKLVRPELDKDPFETLDQESVGNQVRLVVKLGRGTRSHIELGFCGENGGKP